MSSTESAYTEQVEACRSIFLAKNADYGCSWRVYRLISVADQMYIKAKRIRTIQEKKISKVGEGIRGEFMGLYNYAIIGLIQLGNEDGHPNDLPLDELKKKYDTHAAAARALMGNKNHDYDEAWRDMSQESFTDLILSKVLRIKQIIANAGQTRASEGIDANLYDIMNYSVFALILIAEEKHSA